MIERSYTVQEIDELRETIRNKHVYGNYCGPYMKNCIHGYTGSEGTNKIVEDQLRTYMIAGFISEDLKKEGRRIIRQQLENFPELINYIEDEFK